MRLIDILKEPSEWLNPKGNEADVVISSRIRLARNLANFLFPTRASIQQKEEIEKYISSKIKEIPEFQEYIYTVLDHRNQEESAFLFERHLISKELLQSEGRSSLFFKKDESISIMINEEDHLRIQGLRAGVSLSQIYKEINKIDDILETHLPYAYHSVFGYATSCPTNVGTGMRVSFMLHLPGLCLTNQINKIHENLRKKKLNLRGTYGEGTTPLGDLYQISNQVSLGISEENILERLQCIIPQILKYEREVRNRLLENNRESLTDLIKKAYNYLLTMEMIASEQAMTYLSLVRLGCQLELIPLGIKKVQELFLLCQPAHVQRELNLTAEERDIRRAKMIRDYLQN